jgi:hypothetical protein
LLRLHARPCVYACLAAIRFSVSSQPLFVQLPLERRRPSPVCLPFHWKENIMKKYLLIAAAVGALAGPAMAEEVGVRVGPVGAGVTVGEGHRDNDRDRDRDRTVIKEHEPRDHDRTTIIKKDHGDGVETKTIIHHDND